MARCWKSYTADFFQFFWEETYQKLFEGASLVIPLLHPHSDMGLFNTLGNIISHGYLSSGYLPVRIALPSLIKILLGSAVSILKNMYVDALLDYLSMHDREKIKSPLHCGHPFSNEVKTDVTAILSQLGCRVIPTTENLQELIESVAQYEFAVNQ